VIQTSEGDTNSGESGQRKSPSGIQGRSPSRESGGHTDIVSRFVKGGSMTSAQSASYIGDLGPLWASPTGVQEQSPWSLGQGAKPPEAEGLLAF